MIKETVSSNRSPGFDGSNFDLNFNPEPQLELNVAQAQQIIFNYLLGIVHRWSPDDVLSAFSQLFIEHAGSTTSERGRALQAILLANDEREFRNTLKRSCYILVNNWELARQFEAIQALVQLFESLSLKRTFGSPTLRRLRHWISNFADSSDFKQLSLFAARFLEEKTIGRPGEWVSQYSSYLLVSQYINAENPIEQREAARSLSKRLKDQFKRDLAMYTAYSQAPAARQRRSHNPTDLGDEALRLIKAIVAKRGIYSYKNLAHIFLEQTRGISYASFKRNLPTYLFFTVKTYPKIEDLKSKIKAYLDSLYVEHDDDSVDTSLILRTANRMIDSFTTEDREQPSELFGLMLSQGNALTLAIILLKLVLISRGSLLYLEARIGDLLAYYEQFPRDQCAWVINFLEVFRVTFAIYADNVEYNLIQMSTQPLPADLASDQVDWEAFRIYSQALDPTEPDSGPSA